MADPVIERVFLNQPNSGNPGLDNWAADFARAVIQAFQEHGLRLNLAVTSDGDTHMEAPLFLATFTVATLPVAADFESAIIYVSDGAGGQKFRGSDGAAWVNLG